MGILIFTYFLNGLLMLALPIGLGIYLTHRFHLGWRLWWIGAATFVLSQVGHIPFNWIFTRLFALGYLPVPPAAWRTVFNAVFLGLSAGLWEELCRAGAYRWAADEARSWGKGLLMGAGHGGMEAIILGGLVLVSFVNMLVLRGPEAARLVPPAQMAAVQQQVSAYWSAPWPMTLLGAVERFFAIPIQVACSVLVLQAFTRRQPLWVAGAVLWHALVDATSVYLSVTWAAFPWRVYALEGVVAVFAVISVVMIFALRRPEPSEEVEEMGEPAPLAPAPVAAAAAEDDEEDLDRSRYV